MRAKGAQKLKDKPYLFKIVVVEFSQSSLYSIFNPSDIPLSPSSYIRITGVDFAYKTVSIEDVERDCKLQFWFVSPNKERFKSMYPIYFKGSLGAMMLIDSEREETLSKVEEMTIFFREAWPTYRKDNPILLAVDTGICERISPGPRSRLIKFAKRLNIRGITELSIETRRNVNEVFKMMAKLIVNPEYIYKSYYL